MGSHSFPSWARRTTKLVGTALTIGAWLGGFNSAMAQTSVSDSAQTVVRTPGARYGAGWLRRAILGEDYRALWTSPIEVEVLNLRSVAGGLRPTQRGGSMQTNSLRFAGADGREYVFRPLEKDFSKGLPPELRETLVRDIAQDQVVGYHPGAPLVVSSLLDATGLHHPQPRLVVMPDDSLLLEFRAEFRGVLGTFEERPGRDFDDTPETLGAIDVISSERLFERMRKSSSNVPDTRAYLAARLLDILVGDRDRHRDQWRWGRFSSRDGALWEPIPRDRDMPFAKFEGLGPWVIRGIVPQLVTFGSTYPDMVWLNWNAREIDRRLLSSLEWSAWDSAVTRLQSQLTDSVIDAALARMPRPFVERNAPELRSALIARRSHLRDAAASYYAILAREPDLAGTDGPDSVTVERRTDGTLDVALYAVAREGRRGADAPYLARTFHPRETKEVRLFLHGGDDRVVIRGASARGGIRVRSLTGDGDDRVVDALAGGDRAIALYDSSGTDSISSEGKHTIDRTPYRPPPVPRPENAIRDWGSWNYTMRGVSFAPSLGVVGSLIHVRNAYGFRKNPFASRSTYRLDFSLGERRPRLTYDGTFNSMNSPRSVGLEVMASGIEVIRFHGLGNETPAEDPTSYYRVFQNLFRIAPEWRAPLSPAVSISLGAVGQYTTTRDDARTLVAETAPYGSGTFGQVGGRVGVSIDRRDSPTAPTRGFRLSLDAAAYPSLWSVDKPFAKGSAAASAYVSAAGPVRPTLALRAGAEHLWGTFPFQESAFLGGAGTLRGWDVQRFAGRTALYGSAELRLFLRKVSIVVPADMGVLGFADVGRVRADNEQSNTWHQGFGGGVWLAPLMRNYTVSASIARGRERTGFYFASGFTF